MNTTEALPEISLGDLIEQILAFKEAERELNQQLAELKKTRDELEAQVLQIMKDQGLERTGVSGANVIIQRKRFPQVKDWDLVYEFMYQNNAAYILQKRLLSSAVEEFEALGEPIPGVEFYEEDQLTVRRR